VPRDRKLFHDGAAPTLLLTGPQVPPRDLPSWVEHRRIVDESGFAPPALLRLLRARGVRRVLVEGGGVTVSRFLTADALHRLFVTVAPLILGEGRRGLQLPPVQRMAQALRPEVRRFDFEEDVLFDIKLRDG
jgi:riboflavin biosynthesis pyrimidine reductase